MMEEGRRQQLLQLSSFLGISEKGFSLMDQALTHPSYTNENPEKKMEHNQRLEFLGDAVMGILVGEYLFRKFPDFNEGDLTRTRAALVCAPALARVAASLELGKYLYLGKGEEQNGGRERPSVLADALEALVGALYLSGEWSSAAPNIIKLIEMQMAELMNGELRNFKSELQERLQKITGQIVNYRILEEQGEGNDKHFVMGVYFQDQLLGQGSGRSKKAAEQAAAREALSCPDLHMRIRGD